MDHKDEHVGFMCSTSKTSEVVWAYGFVFNAFIPFRSE